MRYMYKLVCLIYFLTYMFTYVWKYTYMLTYMNFLYVTYMSVPYGIYLSELMVKRLWKLSACECVAGVKVLSSEPCMSPADSHVLQMNRYFFACGQSCTTIRLTYLPVTTHSRSVHEHRSRLICSQSK